MNKTVEAIVNGKDVATEDVFELINNYNVTSLSIQDQDSNNTVLKMQVNQFESYKDVFEFSQKCTDENSFVVKQSDIVSMDIRWEEEIDSIIVICQLANNRKMGIVIYYVSKDFSVSCIDEYEEIDLNYLYEFLEKSLDGEYSCTTVRVMDKFSVFLKMTYPDRVYIDTLDDSDWKLHVSDDTNELNISVMDDICNAFYYKEDSSFVEIVVKPYGQPFMEIRMLFFKKGN